MTYNPGDGRIVDAVYRKRPYGRSVAGELHKKGECLDDSGKEEGRFKGGFYAQQDQ